MKVSLTAVVVLTLCTLSLSGCQRNQAEEHARENHKIVVTSPEAKDVTITQQYVCQIRAQRQTRIRSLVDGYLQEIRIKEGQSVKKGDVLFKILPSIYLAKFNAEDAEAKLAELKTNNTKRLAEENVVSQNELKLYQAELARAQAKKGLAKAELDFCYITAPFDGIVDRLHDREGSLIKDEEILTTLSDNSVMWVYFNVPEARYLEYMANRSQGQADLQIELVLANGSKFPHASTKLTIEANFNIENGNIPFRVDFPNPEGLLRDGETGTVRVLRPQKNAIVIPLRATFDILDKRYVWVVGKDHVVRQRLITVKHELEDILVIESGLDVNDKIVLDGIRQVRDGDPVEYQFRPPQEVLANQKYHAE